MSGPPPLAPWFAPLEAIASRGSTAARPGSLAGLHAVRKHTHGQFFTPRPLVDFLWRLVAQVEEGFRARSPGARLGLFDNACGTGRMFWPADPARHVLFGSDIDGDAIAALSAAAKQGGFEGKFLNVGMEDLAPGSAHIAIINPPFGLHLQSPFLEPTPGITTHGRFGPDTSALSQGYAIAQALQACPVVVAVIPSTYEAAFRAVPEFSEHCVAVFTLPPGLFKEEGTDVRVSVAVLSKWRFGGTAPAPTISLSSLTDDLNISIPLPCYLPTREAPRERTIRDSAPTIATAVTGDRTVRVSHSGRRIHLSFACGLVEAKVRNAILRERLQPGDLPHRLPKGVQYAGEGWLDIENLLAAERPEDSLDRLLAMIAAAGGEPAASASLVNHYRNRLRRDRIRRTPFRRWVFASGQGDLSTEPLGALINATVHQAHVVDPTDWCSPVLQHGDCVQIRIHAGDVGREYLVERDGVSVGAYPLESLVARFTPDVAHSTGWRLLHPGRRHAFPELAGHRIRQAEAAGLRKMLSWDPTSNEACYQFDDVVELTMAPRAVAGWDMGTGKCRGAIGLCLMGGQHNLIVCEAHLVPEIVEELEKTGVDPALWQVFERPEQLEDLRRINVVSYTRLRSPIARGAGRRTWASRLRRRIHTCVADEAQILRNRQTQQSQALWMISPKRRYAMTGTPIANYCRDALPLLIWAGGDGTACQAYGEYQPYIQAANLSTMKYAQRGLDVFRERHVSLEWAVREFTEDLRQGAKREVPRLRNVEAFRDLVAPHILRRVLGEPELARWITVPTPTRHVHSVEWDAGHLQRYLTTAWEFAAWYRDQLRRSGESGKNVNLISLLAHINEVCTAANVPHSLKGPAGAHLPVTSKQRYAVDLLERFSNEGRKSLLFATNPSAMVRMADMLRDRGIDSVMYTGDMPIKKRTAALNRHFRRGTTPVAFISYGSGQTGLNLPQASRVVFYNRFWTPKTEEQSGRRVVRPQQQEDVEFHFLHLRGGIDEYQAQMVEHKASAIGAGLDYGEQEIAEGDFLHMSTVLGRFCDDLRDVWGVDHHRDLLEVLKHAA